MNYDEYISFEHQGFPVAIMPDHQDDCERWHYAIKIDHKWYDVDYGALSFDKVAADKVIAKVTKQLLEDYRKRTDELFRERDEAREDAEHWKIEYEIIEARLCGVKHERDNGIVSPREIIPKLLKLVERAIDDLGWFSETASQRLQEELHKQQNNR
jgi:hypothetical protein